MSTPQATAQKFPVISLIVALIAVAVLVSLGTWQLQRLQWKNNLQQELDAAFATYGTDPVSDETLLDTENHLVARGRIDGFIDFHKAILLNGRIQDGKSAMAVVAPLTTMGNKVFAAELGCAVKPDVDVIKALGRKSVIIGGVRREPKWSFATPANIPDKNEWWRLDNQEIGSFWGMPDLQKNVITVENTDDISTTLQPCFIERKLKNDHLSYAGFWFTMALVLMVMWWLRFGRPYLQSA